jgi:ribonucleoside-triphosphate reductase
MGAKNVTGENAADRMTYAGEIFSLGEKKRKEDILNGLPPEWRDLHTGGYIHIHDLDAFGFTYNCLAVDLRTFFPFERFTGLSQEAKIIGVFDFLKEFLTKLGNEQSGGMAFSNFDIETADVFSRLGLSLTDINDALFRAAIGSFFVWCSNSHERLGKVSYYVSLNIGLAYTDLGRYVCKAILEELVSSPATVFKPNVIFKVKKGINFDTADTNYSLFQTALKTTTIKMFPTYLLCDAAQNISIEPEKLAVMGCRTRVVDNKYETNGSTGRGNIANISVNLPRLALEAISDGNSNIDMRLQFFTKAWDKLVTTVAEILEDRYRKLINDRTAEDFRTNLQYDLWCVPFTKPLDEIFKNGTLSIGFIGLSEAVEVLTGKKFYNDSEAYLIAKKMVSYMRDFTNARRDATRFNYSLLATSGELISGRFTDSDIRHGFQHSVTQKGFYTNSFHVDVDSELNVFDKIDIEAPFHSLCNGGCISYIEFKEAPINNERALEELILYAVEKGIHYLGFNFNLDICTNCGTKGIFDKCPSCASEEITRVRRVSGYLEILDYFTKGKKKEVKLRRRNVKK